MKLFFGRGGCSGYGVLACWCVLGRSGVVAGASAAMDGGDGSRPPTAAGPPGRPGVSPRGASAAKSVTFTPCCRCHGRQSSVVVPAPDHGSDWDSHGQ